MTRCRISVVSKSTSENASAISVTRARIRIQRVGHRQINPFSSAQLGCDADGRARDHGCLAGSASWRLFPVCVFLYRPSLLTLLHDIDRKSWSSRVVFFDFNKKMELLSFSLSSKILYACAPTEIHPANILWIYMIYETQEPMYMPPKLPKTMSSSSLPVD